MARANRRLVHSNSSCNICICYVIKFILSKDFQQWSYFYCRANTKKIDKPDIQPEILIKFKLSGGLSNDIIHTPTKFHANLLINVAKTNTRLNIRSVNRTKYSPIVTKIVSIRNNDDIVTFYTKFCAIWWLVWLNRIISWVSGRISGSSFFFQKSFIIILCISAAYVHWFSCQSVEY